MKAPVFTTAAILTLALGLGATTAMFSVVHALLWQSLPFPEPDRLVVLGQRNAPEGVDESVTSLPNLNDWRAARQMAALGGYYKLGTPLTGTGEPEQLTAAMVTEGFFETLGTRALHGQTFGPGVHQPGQETVVVLGHALWQRQFGGNPAIVGQTVMLGGVPHLVAGVMPREFVFPGEVDLWLPLAPAGAFARLAKERGAYWLRVVGRLRPDAGVAVAQAELDVIASRLGAEHPKTNAALGVRVQAMHESLVVGRRPALLMLSGVVLGVLLIACANVANLMLARNTSRQRDIALRAALGAGRRQILNHLLGEALVLSALGGLGGLVVAAWSAKALTALPALQAPLLGQARLNPIVLAFAAVLTVGTALLFGAAPSLQSLAVVGDALKASGKGTPDRSRGRRLRSGLVIVEVALAALLLVGSGLLVRSFAKLTAVDPGFRTERLLTLRVTLPRLKYDKPPQVRDFHLQLLERLEALPGVEAASVSGALMFSRMPAGSSLSVAGRPAPETVHASAPVLFDPVSAGYFETLGVRLIQGRGITEQDGALTAPVAVVNEAFARRIFPGQRALGQRVTLEDPSSPTARWFEIIGIAADVHRQTLEDTASPEIYLPQTQQPPRAVIVAIRTAGKPTDVARAATQTIWSLDRDLPVSRVSTMDALIEASAINRRAVMAMVVALAGLALILAAVGVYGVLSYSTNQRRQEIGVRLALGAQPGDVMRLILQHGLALAGAGLALGFACAIPLARLMSGLLFGVGPLDPVTFAAIATILVGTSATATWLPARRAIRIDPQSALRSE